MAPPFREAEFDIMYGKGISKEGELVDLGVRAEILQKSGAWFSYGERRLAQGRDKTKELLKNDPELAAEIREKIMQNIDVINSKPLAKGSKSAKGKSKKDAKAEAEAEAAAVEESVADPEYDDIDIEADLNEGSGAESSNETSSSDANIDIFVDEE